MPPPPPPRKFGEPRVYRLDGGFKVTIEGDADSIEQDFVVSAENDSLVISTGDAAIRRRMQKQGSASFAPSFEAPNRADPLAPLRSTRPNLTAPVLDPSDPAYTGPREVRNDNFQEEILGDTGTSMGKLAEGFGL
jgi:hypothetical protein